MYKVYFTRLKRFRQQHEKKWFSFMDLSALKCSVNYLMPNKHSGILELQKINLEVLVK
jgi:hypothetical protein